MKYQEKVRAGLADKGGPPSPEIQWSCRRKRFYITPELAELKAQAARDRTHDLNIVKYKCRSCIGWHIGHS